MDPFFIRIFFTVRSSLSQVCRNTPKTCEIDAKKGTIVFAVVDLPKQGALAIAAFPAIEWAFCPQDH